MSDNNRQIQISSQKASFPITAYQHAGKHFDFVLGIDFHWTVTPLNWLPLPLPHAFVGVIFDPMDYLTFTIPIPFMKGENGKTPLMMPMGGSVYIHGRHKATTTTSVMGIAIPSQHLTGMFPIYLIVDKPMAPHEGEVYYGAETVLSQGSEMGGDQPNHVLTCWSPPMGLQSLPTMPDKIKKNPLAYFAFYSRFLKIYLPINVKPPVLLGGIFAPHEYTLQEHLTRFAGLGLMKFAKFLVKTFNVKFLQVKGEKIPGANKLSKTLCFFGFEPVNLVTGAMSFDWEDFELQGSTSIVCNHSWQSDSPFPNMFGNGVFSSFDLKIIPDDSQEFAVWIHPEEQIPVAIPYLDIGEETIYYRPQKIWVERPSHYQYIVRYAQNRYTYEIFSDAILGDIFRIISIEYSDGSKCCFEYQISAYNVLRRITTNSDRILNFELHSNKKNVGAISLLYQENGEPLVKYDYDENGNLIKVYDPQDKAIEFFYNDKNLIIKRRNRNGMEYFWEYDEQGRVIETTGLEGIQHGIIKYYPEQGYNEIIYPRTPDKIEKIFYDEQTRVDFKLDAMGNETWYAYNQWNERTMVATSEGKIEGYEYDDFGNIKTYHSPDGESFSYNYNEIGQLLSAKDPQGNTEYWKYDKYNRLEQYISKDKIEVKYFYKDLNTRLPNKGIYSNGLEIEWEYNDFGQVLSQRDNQCNTERWSYDKFGRLITHQLENGVSIHWKRDVLGRVHKVYHTGQNAIRIKYDAYDLPIFASDGTQDWHMEYTPMGSLKKQVRVSTNHPAQKQTLHYYYDEYENLTHIRNENHETYQFVRDCNDRVIKEIAFDGQEKHYAHNGDGQITAVRLPNDQQIFLDYDLAGRLIHTKHSDGAWQGYQYDALGNLIEAFNEFSEVSFQRDALGRIIRETQGGYFIDYQYDTLGNLTRKTSSLGADLTFERNAFGDLQRIHAPAYGWEILNLCHNQKGQITERKWQNGIQQNLAYDPLGRLTEMSVAGRTQKHHHALYHWKEGDRLGYILNQLTDGKTQFAYDTFGALSSAQYEDGTHDHKNPDAVGNLYRTKDQTDRIYQKGGKLLKDEKYHYLYDRNGNLKLKTQRKVGQHQLKIREEEVSKKPKKFSFFVEEVKEEIGKKDLEYYLRNDRIYTKAEKEEYKRLKAEQEKEQIQNDEWQKGDWAYEWNADGSLKNVKLPNGDLVQYEYDALGRRTKKIVNGKIKRYLWDGNVLLHEWEYLKEEEPKKVVNSLGEISFDRKEPVENLTTWVYEDNSFVPIAKIVDNKCFSIISDYVGRPIQAYDNFGNLVWQTEYDIYGKIRNLKGDREFIPFRQLGQYEDVETGLYYNRFRYYDCNTGTYISKDPIGLLGGFALYGYVKDVNSWVDVFGLHEVIAILNGVPVVDAKGNYSWYSTPGSSKSPFNGYGAKGHSEAKLLQYLDEVMGDNLKGSSLEIVSMGQLTKNSIGQLSPLPPCNRCIVGLQAFAEKYNMDIIYKWNNQEIKINCKS